MQSHLARDADMKLSIIIPVYKTPPDMFSACMESVLSWRGNDIECVLIIDSPEHPIEEAVYAFSKTDARIRVLINERNMGPSYSRNRGIDVARGEYVMMVDADDRIHPDVCKKALESCETYGLGFCAVSRVYPWQNGSNNVQEAAGLLHRGVLCGDSYGEIKYILDKIDMSSSGIVFDKELLDSKHLRYPEMLRHNEDFVFVTSVLATGTEVGLWRENGYDVVWHSDSLSGNTCAKRFVDELNACNMILELLNAIGLPADIARFYAEHGYNEIFEGWRKLDVESRREIARYNLPLSTTAIEYLNRYDSILSFVAKLVIRLAAAMPRLLFKPLPFCNWLFRALRKAGIYYR